jgi:hypothetical protein
MKTIVQTAVVVLAGLSLVEFGCLADAVQLMINVQRNVVRADEEIVLTVRVKNGLNHDIAIIETEFFLNHRLSVTNDQNKEPERTEYGKSLLRWSKPGLGRSRNFPINLVPGQTTTIAELRLSDMYVFRPGRYRISLEYEDEESRGFVGVLRSNIVEVEVKETEVEKAGSR